MYLCRAHFSKYAVDVVMLLQHKLLVVTIFDGINDFDSDAVAAAAVVDDDGDIVVYHPYLDSVNEYF